MTRNGPPGRRELDAVREEIPEDLLEARRVALHARQCRIELAADRDALAPRARTHRVERGRENLGNRHRAAPEFQTEIVDPREVDQVGEHPAQGIGLPEDGLQRAARLGVVAMGIEQDLGPAHDSRQGRADLVREVREKVVLQPVALLQLLDEAGIAQRDGGLLGEERERFPVFRREGVARDREHLENAEPMVADPDRDGNQGVHVRVFDRRPRPGARARVPTGGRARRSLPPG